MVAPEKRFPVTGSGPAYELYVWGLRLAALAAVVIISTITYTYCFNIYHDREQSLMETFGCVNKAISEAGAPHWLTHGSLLGAERLSHFIMWDGDIDISVLVEKMSNIFPIVAKIEQMCQLTTTDRSTVATAEEPGSWRLCTSRTCVVLYEYLNQPEGMMLSQYGEEEQSVTLPLTKCSISGVEASCPREKEPILRRVFGENWRTDRLTSLFH